MALRMPAHSSTVTMRTILSTMTGRTGIGRLTQNISATTCYGAEKHIDAQVENEGRTSCLMASGRELALREMGREACYPVCEPAGQPLSSAALQAASLGHLRRAP